MGDHELLKLAAEAAGYWVECREDDEIHIKTYKYGDYNRWNPLVDDGEALRLAVKLRLTIDIVEWGTSCQPWTDASDTSGDRCMRHAEHKSDPAQATRKAIVRAAAEIGRAMK